MTELELLIAEQAQDDTDVIKPEFRGQVPLTNGISNCIGMELDGEIIAHFPRPPKGSLLVGCAPWHGSAGGYRNHRCRCEPCTEAQRESMAEYRERRRTEAA